MEKISVLIPTYNVENYVEEAIFSILNQTYKNIELIIVDDCSTDNTYDILKKISKCDNRVKLYKNSINKKICYTLNRAYKHSSGAYIARMDGDDISEYDRLEKQINFLKENPEIDLVGVGTISIDENGKEINRTTYMKSFKFLKKAAYLSSPVLHIWMAKREVYEKLNGYRDMPYVEDYDFLLRMISNCFKFSNIGDYYGYKVRSRNGNTASTVGISQRKAFEYCRKLYKERKKIKKDSFDEYEFYEYIKAETNEKIKYNQSIELLNISMNMRSDRRKVWIVYCILAALKSKYQFKYLFRSVLLRCMYMIERLFT